MICIHGYINDYSARTVSQLQVRSQTVRHTDKTDQISASQKSDSQTPRQNRPDKCKSEVRQSDTQRQNRPDKGKVYDYIL